MYTSATSADTTNEQLLATGIVPMGMEHPGWLLS
jgi:hypothetical protein